MFHNRFHIFKWYVRRSPGTAIAQRQSRSGTNTARSPAIFQTYALDRLAVRGPSQRQLVLELSASLGGCCPPTKDAPKKFPKMRGVADWRSSIISPPWIPMRNGSVAAFQAEYVGLSCLRSSLRFAREGAQSTSPARSAVEDGSLRVERAPSVSPACAFGFGRRSTSPSAEHWWRTFGWGSGSRRSAG